MNAMASVEFGLVFQEQPTWERHVSAWYSPALRLLILHATIDKAASDRRGIERAETRWVTVADVSTLAAAVRKSVEFADLWFREAAADGKNLVQHGAHVIDLRTGTCANCGVLNALKTEPCTASGKP